MTNMIQCATPKREYAYTDGPDHLEDWDREKFEKAGIDTVVYWYEAGSYEGSGAALVRKDGKWAQMSLSHCSCYGPVEEGELWSLHFTTLDDIKTRGTKEFYEDISTLIDTIVARGLDLT